MKSKLLIYSFQWNALKLRVTQCQIHVFYRISISVAKKTRRMDNVRRHCVAAPLSKLSIVAQTTTLFPLECTPKPPTSTPCRPAMLLTKGASPIILTSFSPAYRSWNSVRISREVISCFNGILIVCCMIPLVWQVWRVRFTYVYALEPNCNMRYKCDALP